MSIRKNIGGKFLFIGLFSILQSIAYVNADSTIRSEATIHFSNTERTPATISIINMIGENVATIFSGELEEGEYSFIWDAALLPQGCYLCVLKTRSGTEHSVIILQK